MDAVSLEDICGTLETGSIELRGRTWPVRGAPAAATDAFERQLPEPRAPRVMINASGHWKENPDDPAHRLALGKRRARLWALHTAYALNIAGPDGQPWDEARDEGWCVKTADAVLSRFSAGEIDRVVVLSYQLVRGEAPGQLAAEVIGDEKKADG